MRGRRTSCPAGESPAVLASRRGIPYLARVAWRPTLAGHPDHLEHAFLRGRRVHERQRVEPVGPWAACHLRNPDCPARQPSRLSAHTPEHAPRPGRNGINALAAAAVDVPVRATRLPGPNPRVPREHGPRG